MPPAVRPEVINTLATRIDFWTRSVREVPQGSGSGFLWDDAGHIVTNYHVIRGANSAQVILRRSLSRYPWA